MPVRRLIPLMSRVLAIALGLTACTSSLGGHGSNAPTSSSSSISRRAAPSSSSSAPAAKQVTVHVSVNISDGSAVGVGMPYIARFSTVITDGKVFQNATKVTVNGQPVDARWYFEVSHDTSWAMEAHLRTQNYWPANATIHVDLPIQGLSGGAVPSRANTEYVFGDSLTSDFSTTDAHILTVSNAAHTLTVMDNGKQWGVFQISLGAADTPTKNGTKVIMEKGKVVRMRGPGYDDPHVMWTQRLTYDGEYLHSAPWNCVGYPGCTGPSNHIGSSNSSNGCTNLRPDDAIKLYGFLGIGDVVKYPDADGPRMQIGQGYGDWNVTWGLWQTGGAVPTQ
ncbi:MAG TPA: L,D-transpeptidase [Jatrophihabitantaceae bacterium]|nr:L,D-transpeptidase [Jatrophihabitantaceae bacterium]